MAWPGNTVQYCGSVQWTAVATRGFSTAYTVGQLVRDGSAASGNERVFICVAAGTTGSGVPGFAVTRGISTVDGTVTWLECTGAAGLNGDLTNTPNWVNGAKGQSPSRSQIIQSGDGTKLLIAFSISGASGSGAEPTWSDTVGGTVVDGGVTWMTIKRAGATYAPWSCPHARMTLMAGWLGTAGESATVGFIASNHSEATSLGLGFGKAGCQYLCVNPAAAPPAALATGAVVEYNGTAAANDIGFSLAVVLVHGITFRMSASTSNAALMAFTAHGTFRSCRFEITGTGTGTNISIGGSLCLRWDNCVLKFGAITQTIKMTGGAAQDFVWRGGSIDNTGSMPTILFTKASTAQQEFELRGVDLRGFGSKSLVDGTWIGDGLFEDCIWDAATLVVSANITDEATRIRVIRSPSAGVDRGHLQIYGARGSVLSDEVLVRTGGAAVNGVSISWKISNFSGAVVSPGYPFSPPPMQISNTIVANTSMTVYGIINAAALPALTDLYLGITYLASDASCLGGNDIEDWGYFATPGSVAADTSAWDSLVTARANAHVYAAGDQIKSTNNAGRVFFCTTPGTSAGSEPGGYATAVDGGSVTDGTAVFRAGVRFALTRSVSPLLTGALTVRVHASLANTSWWIDPALDQA